MLAYKLDVDIELSVLEKIDANANKYPVDDRSSTNG